MPVKSRKGDNGVIVLHKPVPPHLLHRTSPRSVGQKSSSVAEYPYIRSVTRRSTRVVTHLGTEADMARTLSPCSIKQLQDQFLSEQQEADAIAQPLLDTENGFIRDLELFLNHRDMLTSRKRELLHKRWTECVWRPVQCSVEVNTPPLKDPLYLQSSARMREKRAVLRCQTGCVDERQWVESVGEQSRNKSYLHRASRSRDPVYMATADGRCFRPECWSSIGPSSRSLFNMTFLTKS